MKARSAKKAVACLLLAGLLSSCLSYDSGSSDDDTASNNNVITDNSVNTSDAQDTIEASPCESLIWKPESEKDGNLALIFDAMFSIPFSSIELKRAVEGTDEAELEFAEFSSFDENGRQVWRAGAPGGEYSGEFRVEYGTESCSGEVEDPAERSE